VATRWYVDALSRLPKIYYHKKRTVKWTSSSFGTPNIRTCRRAVVTAPRLLENSDSPANWERRPRGMAKGRPPSRRASSNEDGWWERTWSALCSWRVQSGDHFFIFRLPESRAYMLTLRSIRNDIKSGEEKQKSNRSICFLLTNV